MTDIPDDVFKDADKIASTIADTCGVHPGWHEIRVVAGEIIARAIMAERERQWQPIETAPKDGTQVLAFAKGQGGIKFFGVAQWAEADPDFPLTVTGWFWSFAIRPTHWQPLPQPPSERDSHEGFA